MTFSARPTSHPTPWGGSPTPRRMLAVPPDEWGPTNGRIWPRGWVAKMGVLQQILGEMGKTAKTVLHEDISLELSPTPHPTPSGAVPHPKTRVGRAPRWVGTHRFQIIILGGQS